MFDNTAAGATDTTAPDGTPVSAGFVYLSSEGWAEQVSRKFIKGFAVPTSGGGDFDQAVVANRLEVLSNFQINSYDSSLGLASDPGAAVADAATVATNSVSSGAVTLEPGVTIDGEILVGPGGGAGVVNAASLAPPSTGSAPLASLSISLSTPTPAGPAPMSMSPGAPTGL